MHFRYARHTNNLKRLERFYVEVLSFEKIGEFNEHDGYNGIFLTKEGHDWHLEFTESQNRANHQFDEDDLLVFYASSKNELADLEKKLDKHGVEQIKAANPYWDTNGIMFQDPDGFRIVFSLNSTFSN